MKTINDFNPVIVRLSDEEKELVKDFNAGTNNYAFNLFIKKDAFNEIKSGDSITYLVVNEKEDESKELVAYYAISTGAINIVDRYDYEDDEVPEDEKREHYSPISSIYINMFAVDESYQDTLYNESLISGMILRKIILELIEMTTTIIGAKMITLCSVKKAVKFYEDNAGFEKLESKYTILDKSDAYDNVPMKLILHTIT